MQGISETIHQSHLVVRWKVEQELNLKTSGQKLIMEPSKNQKMLCDRCLKEFEKEDPASKVVYDDDGLLFEFCSKKRANLYTLEALPIWFED